MPSFLQYRRALQAALDDGQSYLLSTASGLGGTAPALSDNTTNASVSRYNGAWVYVATGTAADQQRRFKTDGFTPSTGAFLVELGWASPAAQDEIEITHLFPCGFGPEFSSGVPAEDTSYLSLVNSALASLWAPDRISLTFSNSATASTSAYPWLDRPERLVRVLEPAPVSGFPDQPCEWRRPELVFNGTTPVLQINRPFTGTLTLEVRRPGDTLISGAESAAGLATSASTALCSIADVVTVGLREAYRALMNRNPGRPNGDWAKKYGAQEEIVAGLYYIDRTQQARQAPPQPVQGAA